MYEAKKNNQTWQIKILDTYYLKFYTDKIEQNIYICIFKYLAQ